MDCRYNENGVSWNDSALDWSEEKKVKVEGGGHWFQNMIIKLCGYHGQESIKGMSFDYVLWYHDID